MSFDSNLRERSPDAGRSSGVERSSAAERSPGVDASSEAGHTVGRQRTRTAATRPLRPTGGTVAAGARRPSGVAWDHGITAIGAGVLALAVTLLAAILDAVFTRSFGWLFTIGFLLGCLYVGLRVRRRELLASVVVPPLVFATTVVIAGQFLPVTSDSGWLTRQVLDLATTLALGAPVLLGGTALAGAIALGRRFLPQLAQRGGSAAAR